MKLGNPRSVEIELDLNSALDVGSCRVAGTDVSPGDAVPDDGDPRILHAVHGFLFTCGPDHIRHPEPIEGRAGDKYPLHGSMAGNPAEVLSSSDEAGSQTVEARVRARLAQGGEAEIRRRWHYDASDDSFLLEDTVTNAGETAFPPMLMYHMNIGARLFDDATTLSGESFEGGRIGWRFGQGDGLVFCVPARGEDGWAHVVLGPIGAAGGRSLHVKFATTTLPHLQMWRNQAGRCNVLGIEPASHPWKPRTELAAAGLMGTLAPGEARRYSIGFSFR